jgi:hypothetical protein
VNAEASGRSPGLTISQATCQFSWVPNKLKTAGSHAAPTMKSRRTPRGWT